MKVNFRLGNIYPSIRASSNVIAYEDENPQTFITNAQSKRSRGCIFSCMDSARRTFARKRHPISGEQGCSERFPQCRCECRSVYKIEAPMRSPPPSFGFMNPASRRISGHCPQQVKNQGAGDALVKILRAADAHPRWMAWLHTLVDGIATDCRGQACLRGVACRSHAPHALSTHADHQKAWKPQSRGGADADAARHERHDLQQQMSDNKRAFLSLFHPLEYNPALKVSSAVR